MKHPDIIRQGIRYSAYSDRGKQVKDEMRREKRDRTTVPISALLAFGGTVALAANATWI